MFLKKTVRAERSMSTNNRGTTRNASFFRGPSKPSENPPAPANTSIRFRSNLLPEGALGSICIRCFSVIGLGTNDRRCCASQVLVEQESLKVFGRGVVDQRSDPVDKIVDAFGGKVRFMLLECVDLLLQYDFNIPLKQVLAPTRVTGPVSLEHLAGEGTSCVNPVHAAIDVNRSLIDGRLSLVDVVRPRGVGIERVMIESG